MQLRSLTHYWRTNLAVVAGVAVAVAVLAGALVVGDSVRASLRELAVGRLGRTDHLIASTGFFREALVDGPRTRARVQSAQFSDVVGIVAIDGLVAHASNGTRASNVAIYGVDERFFRFHGKPLAEPLTGRDALASPALARELSAASGDGLLVRLRQPSAIPAATLHGRRDELGKTVRVRVRGVLAADALGEFSLRAQQGEVRALFVPLGRLQQRARSAEARQRAARGRPPERPRRWFVARRHPRFGQTARRLRIADADGRSVGARSRARGRE